MIKLSEYYFRSRILMTMVFNLTLLSLISGQAVVDSGVQHIIDKIKALESRKDAKCYATANRLEDFIYGTPLDDGARNIRIDIQKDFIYYLKEQGSDYARTQKHDSIYLSDLKAVIDTIFYYGRLKNGDWFIGVNDGYLQVTNVDVRQYSSVSYAYRSLLSVEQDLLFIPESNILPIASETIEPLYQFVNFITLATLKIADATARAKNKRLLSKSDIIDSWILLLEQSKGKLSSFEYPELDLKDSDSAHNILRDIIRQKQESYNNYNQLNASVFLRNIQVYFAKQRWPSDPETSKVLKNYFLESLIDFSEELIKEAENKASKQSSALVRLQQVQEALEMFMPFSINQFEDVCYFPALGKESITIESYDLDAFRDSGWHWQILGYALDDLGADQHLSLDPNAAELVVEGIAQMGVLVLRMAGAESKLHGKTALDKEDFNIAFRKIQNKIANYSVVEKPTSEKEKQFIAPADLKGKFENHTSRAGIDFIHKSSDWLNRAIRSYVFSSEENTAKMAIPPAFGGSGVAAEDLNNDGFCDILILGGFGNHLYINQGDGEFVKSELSDQLSVWNEALKSYGEPRQPIIADFDNDGYKDILITYVNDTHRLYKNLDGKALLDVTDKAGLGGQGQVAGPATCLDYDNDGKLDLFIGYFGNYLRGNLPTLSRHNQNGDPNKLFRNLGDMVFEEVKFDQERNNGWTQAMGHSDLNRDGLQDIIAGNDFGVNEYYINLGNGKFSEQSEKFGTNKPSYTMNVGIADLNRDRFPDLYISNIVVMQKDEKYVSPNEETTMKFDPQKMKYIRTVEANDLFLSNVKGEELIRFELSDNVGRGYSSTGWSWDADFFDFDNDGDEDLYCLNGMNDFSVYSSENPAYYGEDGGVGVEYAESHREKNVFFVNENGLLINQAEELGADLLSNARSASYFDFDNDGDLDIIINNYHDESVLLKNNQETDNNWIKILLEGDPSRQVNRDAIGATIIVNSENHKNIWREVHSTDGYLSVHPKEQHFGIGSDEYAEIQIIWPNGKEVIIDNLTKNKSY
ncbi:MAG: CRTAC1 family protein, partial [Saprospiraceae bacterium]|nr:CRTAC1 family protein [Saprospiraceae bacterium]